jgi:membrane protein DedA with SNARE-associated domain
MSLELASREALEAIAGYMRTYAVWSGPILFAIMALEGVILTTFIFSGSLTILAAGVLVQQGVLPLAPTFAAIVLGFWFGDWVNYEFGRRGEAWMRSFAIVQRNTALLDRAEAFLGRWEKASIFLSRFMGPFRPFVVFLAGPAGIRPGVFHAMTLVSTLLVTAGLLNAGMTGVQLWERFR